MDKGKPLKKRTTTELRSIANPIGKPIMRKRPSNPNSNMRILSKPIISSELFLSNLSK